MDWLAVDLILKNWKKVLSGTNTKTYMTVDTLKTKNFLDFQPAIQIMMNTMKLMKLKRATMWQFRHIWWPWVQVEDTKVPDVKVPGLLDKRHDIAQEHQKLQEETIIVQEVDQHLVIIVQIYPIDLILELEGRHVHAQGI